MVDEEAMLVTRASDISEFPHLRGPILLPEEKKLKPSTKIHWNPKTTPQTGNPPATARAVVWSNKSFNILKYLPTF